VKYVVGVSTRKRIILLKMVDVYFGVVLYSEFGNVVLHALPPRPWAQTQKQDGVDVAKVKNKMASVLKMVVLFSTRCSRYFVRVEYIIKGSMW